MSGANGGSDQDELVRGRDDFLRMVSAQTALLDLRPELTRYLEARLDRFQLAFTAAASMSFIHDVISGAARRGTEDNRMMFVAGFLAAYVAIERGDVRVTVAEQQEEDHGDTREAPF